MTKEETIAEIHRIAEECNHPNWDSYDALPTKSEAVETAIRFLDLLPDDVSMPDVSPDNDGEISFDWGQGFIDTPYMIICTTANPDKFIAVWKVENDPEREVFLLEEGRIPQRIVDVIRQIPA